MSGTKLGRYEILGELGRGAMGVVYRARDPIIDRVVALKTIDLALTGAALASFEERFFQEARSAGRLNHPNIVTIYDAGKADGVAYIAMEFLEGASLREVLDEHPPLGVARVVETAAQIARGLAYAHEHGVVHRDIKPANVIILKNRRPKITDFGIARLGEADGISAERVGSPKYMSPEQIRADATLDGRSDVYSLGAVLYEMLTGRAAFTGESVTEIMRQVLEVNPPPPSMLNARVPPELDGIVMRMLAKRAEERYPSARSLFRDLRRLEETLDEIGSLSTRNAEELEAAALAAAGGTASGDSTLVLASDAVDRPVPVPRTRRTLRRVAAYAAVLAVIAVGAMIPLRLQFSDANATKAEAVAPPPQPIVAAAPEPVAPPPVVVAPPPPPPVPEEKPVEVKPAPPPETKAPPPARKPEPKRQAAKRPPEPPPVTVAVAAPPPPAVAPAPPATGKIVLAVSPWGDVYVDGKHLGSTPPLSSLDLTPGKHKIEIRNATLVPYLTYLTVDAGETHKIHHIFVE
jgi:serine/threonine-protein kinase